MSERRIVIQRVLFERWFLEAGRQKTHPLHHVSVLPTYISDGTLATESPAQASQSCSPLAEVGHEKFGLVEGLRNSILVEKLPLQIQGLLHESS